MDKSCHSSGDSTTNNSSNSCGGATSGSRDHYLKHLNKLSHKISKPTIKKPPFDHPPDQNHNFRPPPPPPPPPASSQQQQSLQGQQQQNQPPVYNINKNDFRDVVQKLTGSPAHERFSTPPPIHPPKPQSSRLQRIRPPPLAHVSNRPPPLLNGPLPPIPNPTTVMNPNNPAAGGGGGPGLAPNFGSFGRAPLSPLPPLPSVHAAAESPVSAYMRFLQNSASNLDSNPKQFSGFSPLAPLVSPRWNNQAPPLPLPQQQHQLQLPPPPQQGTVPPQSQSQPQFQLPSSPLPFGCLNSPRSPYPLLSPGVLFSPSSGQLGFPQFPLSPKVPVSSPRWRDL